jgi:hypothetical protein
MLKSDEGMVRIFWQRCDDMSEIQVSPTVSMQTLFVFDS